MKTDDGFTLTMFHLTGDQDGPYEITKPAVVLQHGMGGQGINYTYTLNMNSDPPFAYQLAKMGFDIWLTNNRGTTYSQVHDKYTIADPEFW